ncbi:hypothetical protein HUU62_26540 [Rhodoferax sp. 4810]|uniref:Uncharacterized protein n=1 Tax=Thiospirillum jenense TaxID=1653858 RepID=A0A839HGA7_9GAMM|nr:hypothetical protein [Thiospirillum jenense]MBB1077960.1 hypothetical protein [Rhodoferax jenense]MBB1127384.1 hypothetical protein [Thiospirillum jenense]
MKNSIKAAIIFCLTLKTILPVFAGQKIEGTYNDKYGSTIVIKKSSERDDYLINGDNHKGTTWEGVGFYSIDCNCIKSVFRYTSKKEKYGDNPGYHRFLIKNDGDMLICNGGWDSLDEFKEGTYSRSSANK